MKSSAHFSKIKITLTVLHVLHQIENRIVTAFSINHVKSSAYDSSDLYCRNILLDSGLESLCYMHFCIRP
jgi:hypothetical protein